MMVQAGLVIGVLAVTLTTAYQASRPRPFKPTFARIEGATTEIVGRDGEVPRTWLVDARGSPRDGLVLGLIFAGIGALALAGAVSVAPMSTALALVVGAVAAGAGWLSAAPLVEATIRREWFSGRRVTVDGDQLVVDSFSGFATSQQRIDTGPILLAEMRISTQTERDAKRNGEDLNQLSLKYHLRAGKLVVGGGNDRAVIDALVRALPAALGPVEEKTERYFE